MDVVISPDGAKVYVSTGRGRGVAVIDAASYEVISAFETGARVWGLAMSPDGKTLYTANGPSNDVSVVNIDTEQVVKRIPVGERPWGVLYVP